MDVVPAIAAQDISKQFKAKGDILTALDKVSLTVPPRAMTALIGPDGAGKTTFLRLVCGLMRPTTGSLAVLNTDVLSEPQAVQSRISYMPQKFGLYEDLTVQENLDLYADLHGVAKEARRERFGRLMEMTGLAPFTKRMSGKLSGGMKQKLGLACTLVRAPELLVLDEPTVGVDPLSRRELWAIISQMVQEEALSVLVTTAYMDEAQLCQQVIVLHEGRILAQGAPADIKRPAEGLCYVMTPDPNEPPRLLQARLLDDRAHVIDAVPQSGWVRCIINSTSAPNDVAAAAAGTAPRTVAAKLEDGFMVRLRRYADEQQKSDLKDFPAASPAAAANPYKGIVIEVRDLVRKFGDFVAVNNTSFSVASGEIFGLLGPNGAGKTTTFRMLCGLLPATSGHLSVAGVNLRKSPSQARAKIGYVAQKFALYGNLTVTENLRFFGGVYGLRGKRLQERMAAVKNQFNLTGHEDEASGLLPGGFKQRLAMAVGLIHQPEILFLDEPTSGIDPLARRAFWRQITDLATRGTTIIITTHFMEEAEYCDRILIQDQGKMLALGTPADVRTAAGDVGISMDEAFIKIIEKAHVQSPVKEAA